MMPRLDFARKRSRHAFAITPRSPHVLPKYRRRRLLIYAHFRFAGRASRDAAEAFITKPAAASPHCRDIIASRDYRPPGRFDGAPLLRAPPFSRRERPTQSKLPAGDGQWPKCRITTLVAMARRLFLVAADFARSIAKAMGAARR